MEELKAQLQGNNSGNENVPVVCSETNGVQVFMTNNNSKTVVESVNRLPFEEQREMRGASPSLFSSSTSSSSSDDSGARTSFALKRVSTVECLQTELNESYEQSRHDSTSLSLDSLDKSVEVNIQENKENLRINDRSPSSDSDSEFEFLEAECEINIGDDDEDEEEFHDLMDDQNLIETSVDDENGYHTLSPIQEKSEPSSNSTDSQVNGHKSLRFSDERNMMRMLSSSLHTMSNITQGRSQDQLLKSQTFPRYKVPTKWRCNFEQDFNPALFPLEPRELDPSCFHQLHAADSQEELQEFLLLESECMTNDESRGLAAAFTSPESDERTSSEGENGSQKGNETDTNFLIFKGRALPLL